MSTEDRNGLPPLAAGSGRTPGDPQRDAFRKATPEPAGGTTPKGGAVTSGPAGGTTPSGTGKPEPAGGEKAKPAPRPEDHTPFVRTGVFWGLVAGVALAVLVITFSAQNTQGATVKALAWEWTSPLFVVILLSLLVGIVLDEIVGLLYRSRRRRRLAEKAELRRLRGKH